MTGISKLERITGALIGYACADSMGAVTEFMNVEEIKEKYGRVTELLGGGWLAIEPGQITDDTEMMLCVARSLAENNGTVDYKDMADRLVAWWQDDPIDVGHACREGLFGYAKNGSLCNGDDESLGNGGLLRVLPFILCGRSWEEAMFHCKLTHNASGYYRPVQAYCNMVRVAMSGKEKIEILRQLHGVGGRTPKEMNGGMVRDTLKSAIHHFFSTETFEDCIISAVNAGNDADSVAAIAGGLAGAFFGLNAIPQRWVQTLNPVVREECLELGEKLAGVFLGR